MRLYRALLIVFGCFALVYSFQTAMETSFRKDALNDLRKIELPDFAINGLFDDPNQGFSQTDFRAGDVTVINFFASWCIPCLAEHRFIKSLVRETNVPVFGVNLQDDPEQAARWLRDLGSPYVKVGADPDGSISRRLGVRGIPVTLVIDGTGYIRYRYDGPITERLLHTRVLPVVQALQDRPHL